MLLLYIVTNDKYKIILYLLLLNASLAGRLSAMLFLHLTLVLQAVKAIFA